MFLYKEKTSSYAAAKGRELHVDFQKKQKLRGKKLDVESSNHFPESSGTVLLFSVEMYEDSCEITNGDMGPCLHPEGTQPGCTTGTVPEQGLAKLQQQLAGKGVRRTTETAQEEEEGKSAKKSCYDPT